MDCYPLLGEGKGSPAGRKPSPTGKVDRAQPGTDEGCRTKIAKQATLNGKRFRSTWPVFDFSVVFPHPSRLTACHLPRGGRRPPAGAFIPSPGRGWPGQSPGRVWGGTQNPPGTAPLPPLRRHLPPGEGKGTPPAGAGVKSFPQPVKKSVENIL